MSVGDRDTSPSPDVRRERARPSEGRAAGEGTVFTHLLVVLICLCFCAPLASAQGKADQPACAQIDTLTITTNPIHIDPCDPYKQWTPLFISSDSIETSGKTIVAVFYNGKYEYDATPNLVLFWLKRSKDYFFLQAIPKHDLTGELNLIKDVQKYDVHGESLIDVRVYDGGQAGFHRHVINAVMPDGSFQSVLFRPAPDGIKTMPTTPENLPCRGFDGDHLFMNNSLNFEFPLCRGQATKNCCEEEIGTLRGSYAFTGTKHFDTQRRQWTSDFQIIVDTYTKVYK